MKGRETLGKPTQVRWEVPGLKPAEDGREQKGGSCPLPKRRDNSLQGSPVVVNFKQIGTAARGPGGENKGQ